MKINIDIIESIDSMDKSIDTIVSVDKNDGLYQLMYNTSKSKIDNNWANRYCLIDWIDWYNCINWVWCFNWYRFCRIDQLITGYKSKLLKFKMKLSQLLAIDFNCDQLMLMFDWSIGEYRAFMCGDADDVTPQELLCTVKREILSRIVYWTRTWGS
jgi:hypothetical protein